MKKRLFIEFGIIISFAFLYWALTDYLWIQSGQDFDSLFYKASYLLFLTPVLFLASSLRIYHNLHPVKKVVISVIITVAASIFGLILLDNLGSSVHLAMGGRF